MNLADEYKRQFDRRSWAQIYGALPSLKNLTILDLGCGPGDQAQEFCHRGARVIGIDMIDELLTAARARNLPNASFVKADLRAPFELDSLVDLIWCGFSAAYFPDLSAALKRWTMHLRPGGWFVCIEIDDFFGHEPLSKSTAAVFAAYAKDALAAARYDFHMGRKLRDYLQAAGLHCTTELFLEDQDFSFTGPAQPDVLDAWNKRFGWMTLLRNFCGPDFDSIRREFLECLASPNHTSNASVQCCIATN